jgi:hypothetical protein
MTRMAAAVVDDEEALETTRSKNFGVVNTRKQRVSLRCSRSCFAVLGYPYYHHLSFQQCRLVYDSLAYAVYFYGVEPRILVYGDFSRGR